MIRPTVISVFVHGVSLLALIAVLLFRPSWIYAWAWLIGVVWAIHLLDLFSLPSKRRVQASVAIEPRLSLSETDALHCLLSNSYRWRPVRGTLVAQADGGLLDTPSLRWHAPADSQSQLELPLQSWRRGDAQIARLELRCLSLLGFFERRWRLPCEGLRTHVYANFDAVQRAAAHNTTLQSYLQGLKVQRHIGDGQAFEALRQFQPGHDTRAIDWSATARMRSLHVREFREERNHNLILAFDTGRLMARDVEGLARLDHALNASLHLGYVALRMHDRVGVFGFDAQIRCWSAPRAGIETLPHIIEEAQALPYTLNVPDFRSAFIHLNQKLRRRSVVFLFTNVDGQLASRGLLDALAPLHKKHQVNVVAVDEAPSHTRYATLHADEIDTALAAATLTEQRQTALRELRSRGIRVIDAQPRTLAPQLLEVYHDIKRRGLV